MRTPNCAVPKALPRSELADSVMLYIGLTLVEKGLLDASHQEIAWISVASLLSVESHMQMGSKDVFAEIESIIDDTVKRRSIPAGSNSAILMPLDLHDQILKLFVEGASASAVSLLKELKNGRVHVQDSRGR